MEAWLECWNCENQTPQTRIAYEQFSRVQEIFGKTDNGKVSEQYYAPIIASHCFYKCRKCDAPNYFVHEFWPPKDNTESSVQYFWESIESSGSCKHEMIYAVHHYPTFNKAKYPEWTKDLPEDLMKLIWEVYSAYNMAMPTLCSIGIRTVIDVFAVRKVGDVGGFERKLKRLKEEAVINDAQLEALSAMTDVGSASAHRGFRPEKFQVEASLAALEAIFFFESKKEDFKEWRRAVPSRTK